MKILKIIDGKSHFESCIIEDVEIFPASIVECLYSGFRAEGNLNVQECDASKAS